jgi:membrane-bound lytic murein transglycosylase C
MIKYILTLALVTNIFALTFDQYQKAQNNSFTKYQKDINKEFKAYKKAYDDEFKKFSKQLGKKWPTKNGKADISTKHKFVEYDKDLTSKKSIDFEKKLISLEVIASSEDEAKRKISNMFKDILNKSVKDAYKKDILEKRVYKRLKKKRVLPKTKKTLIADIITKKDEKKMKKTLNSKKLIVVKHNGHFIYKANIKMPSNSIINKAKKFKSVVIKNSNRQKIPAELIYAIMHSESSFNPMARSHIPAFGLMQIVPRSAGVDSYMYLYKKRKVLSSSYLYSSDKNIMIGSAYLHVLYYRYLKKIKDPQSRLYCAISAYNTGAGNVAKAFIGSTNINRAAKTINKMSSDQVYKKLMRNLPYTETRHYLKKVNDRVSAYNKLLKKEI